MGEEDNVTISLSSSEDYGKEERGSILTPGASEQKEIEEKVSSA